MHFEIVDRCPVPVKLAAEIRKIKEMSGATLNSCDRSPQAEPYLRQHGKKSQRELYEGFVRGLPGYNPANPPGRSTHERRSDGVAFPGPVGRRLPYWQVGMDWSDPGGVIRAAAQLGWRAVVTYPNNPREGQHINFRREPILKVIPMLRRGDRGWRVVRMTRQLAFVASRETGERYLDRGQNVFDEKVEEALKRFQRDHHQMVDGVYGPQSAAQLASSVREWRRRRREGRGPRPTSPADGGGGGS